MLGTAKVASVKHGIESVDGTSGTSSPKSAKVDGTNGTSSPKRWSTVAHAANLVLILTLYALAYTRTSTCHVARVREKRDVPKNLPSDLEDYTVIIGQDTIIPKSVFERSCKRVHQYCADNNKKLMGFQGPRGIPGVEGPVGPPGRRGPTGNIGPAGLVGDIGEPGPRGTDGTCNCSLPHLYVSRIAIPGPPIIQIEEKTVPVPVVVVKEVEVTRLVPFEPTPPGFAPPKGWSPGMPRPDLSKTRIIPRVSTVLPSNVTRRRRPPTTPPTTTFPPYFYDENGTLLFSSYEEYSSMTNSTGEYSGPPTLGYNRRECVLAAVGIPVLHAESQYGEVGSWMRDVRPSSDVMANKRWITDGFASPVLYEYENERELMDKKQKIKYYVDFLASGTGNMMYNGTYYYHHHGTNRLVRYVLDSTLHTEHVLENMAYRDCARLPDHTFQQCNESERDPWLYNRPHNYVDYAVDENGLWVIYMKKDIDAIVVSKIEEDLSVVQTWQMDEVNATELADAFILCGVFYGLKSSTDRDTFIHFAYDLYRNETIAGQVAWYNPYRGVTMLHFNPFDGRIYFFDNRRLLSVNVRMEEEAPPDAAPVGDEFADWL